MTDAEHGGRDGDARTEPVAAVTLDADGLTCGSLEPLIAQRLRALAPGEVLEVLSDRGEAADGIRAWTALTGHALIAVRTDPASRRTSYFVRKKAAHAG